MNLAEMNIRYNGQIIQHTDTPFSSPLQCEVLGASLILNFPLSPEAPLSHINAPMPQASLKWVLYMQILESETLTSFQVFWGLSQSALTI